MTFVLLRRQVRWPRRFRSFLQIRAERAPSSLVSRESYDHRSCRANLNKAHALSDRFTRAVLRSPRLPVERDPDATTSRRGLAAWFPLRSLRARLLGRRGPFRL